MTQKRGTLVWNAHRRSSVPFQRNDSQHEMPKNETATSTYGGTPDKERTERSSWNVPSLSRGLKGGNAIPAPVGIWAIAKQVRDE
jgi:hypothetical protein